MRIRWFESNKSGSYWVLAALWREPQKDRPNADVASFQPLPGLMLHFSRGRATRRSHCGGKRGNPNSFHEIDLDARQYYNGFQISQRNGD